MNNINNEILNEVKEFNKASEEFSNRIKQLNDCYADKILSGLGKQIKNEIKISKEDLPNKENKIKKFFRKLFYTCK